MLKTPSRKPIEIKISTVVAVSVILHDADMAVLDDAMKDMTNGDSDFFEDELAIIDVASLDPAGVAVDWLALVGLLGRYRLNPVAVRNAPPAMHAEILALGLSLDTNVTARQAATAPVPAAKELTAPVAPPMLQPGVTTMIVDTPVRAGQRIYARGADLIINAAVNNGAEVIADGSIHVYAPLRGRALAGASGNPDARIFAMTMEAELVSIAGMYRTFENGCPEDLANRPVQIRLIGDRIDLTAISPATR
ncbi:MAG: septum site-determining protein MinC [Herminiimonas sp.]|nr:septum site-determining protein MinC [Herminiimonas sp.]